MPRKIESKLQFRFLWSEAHKKGKGKAITMPEMKKLAHKTDYDKLPAKAKKSSKK